MTTPDPYSLAALPRSGPAPRGLDGKSDVLLSYEDADGASFMQWEPWEIIAEYHDRPEESQSRFVLLGMWGLGLCAGLCVIGAVWQMVTGGRW